MKLAFLPPRAAASAAFALAGCVGAAPALAQAEAPVVYKCPGNLYTNSPREAKDKGCRALEGAPVTIISSPKPRAAPAPGPTSGNSSSTAAAARPADQRVDAAEQRARDSDARRILEAELAREQERYAALQREYNNGEPERQGNERNYQKYLDRVEDLKASLARKESDIAAIKRELAKLPQ